MEEGTQRLVCVFCALGGYSGRILFYEVVYMNPLWEQISENLRFVGMCILIIGVLGMLAKGVEHSVAETAIANEYGEEEQRKALSALMRKDSAAFGAEGDKAAKDRLIRRMISKGFPQGMIIDILADIEKNDADI